jgi:hypothetical protein
MEKKLIQRWKELPFLYKIQIWAYLLSGVCGAIAYPLITKLIYGSVETETLASRLVLSSLIGLVLSVLWLNIQEKLYTWFIHFTVIECLCYTVLITYVILYRDFDSYLILSTIIGGTIGHIVNGANSKLHQQITDNEQYRTDYGFFIEIVASIGVLVGSAIAVAFNINVPFAFILLLLSLIGFQITDIYVYKNVNKYKK